MGQLVLVLGGARGGKSAFAQQLAGDLGGRDVLFVATAEAFDDEMRARIDAHQRERPPGWRTLEAPRAVAEALAAAVAGARVVLLDCMTLLVSNVMLALGEEPDAVAAQQAVESEVRALLAACDATDATFIIVSNEVGMGLVPPYRLGRLYRDLLGRANQMLAARAERVYFLLAGLPLELKPVRP
ncbi:MAG: bifunctional adenosylcobinamide kinase/adenosylcobinamide-phosphate guanylyltransferase [Anaerolineae bacterium]